MNVDTWRILSALALFFMARNRLAKQFWPIDAKNFSQLCNFKIGHPSCPRFNFRQRIAAQIPSSDIQLGGHGFLSETSSHTEFP